MIDPPWTRFMQMVMQYTSNSISVVLEYIKTYFLFCFHKDKIDAIATNGI